MPDSEPCPQTRGDISPGLSSLLVPPMSEVTRVLSAIEGGDPHAAEQLLPLVYDELRRLAAQKLAQEKPGQTLEATALVHEAYIRLVDVDKAQHWNSRLLLVRNFLLGKPLREGSGLRAVGMSAPALGGRDPLPRRRWESPQSGLHVGGDPGIIYGVSRWLTRRTCPGLVLNSVGRSCPASAAQKTMRSPSKE